MKKLVLVMALLATMLVACPATEPPYTGGYTDDSQLAIALGTAMADRTIPISALRNSTEDFNKAVLPLTPKSTDSATGRYTSYEKQSLGVLLKSLRDDGKTAKLAHPFIQFDVIMAVRLGGERDVRFFGDETFLDDSAASSTQTAAELIGLLALARFMGVEINGGGSTTTNITTFNTVGWCQWPYPYYYMGMPGWRYGQCGPWWYWSKSDSQIPPLPIGDITSPSGAVVVNSDMDRIVIRYGYKLPDDSAVQKMLTVYVDNDNDGIPNMEENANGTDPNNPNSPGTGVTIPNLTGLTEQQARQTLMAAGFVVGTVTTSGSTTIPTGIVISWNPTGSAPAGTTINLVISSGSGTGSVNVPNLTGLTESQARTAVLGVGLTVGNVTRQTSSTIPAGIVVSWNPTGSQLLGTAINIVVSSGPSGSALFARIVSPPNGTVLTAGQAIPILIEYGGGTGDYVRVQLFSELDGQFRYTATGWSYVPMAITAGNSVKIWLIVQDSSGAEVRDSINVTSNPPSTKAWNWYPIQDAPLPEWEQPSISLTPYVPYWGDMVP